MVTNIVRGKKLSNNKFVQRKNLAIKARNLWKIYNTEEIETTALEDISLDVEIGSFIAIIGPSGSGKSTLLHLLAGLDKPTKKDNQILEINKESILDRTENWLSEFRAKNIGFVLQFFGLLETLTALENVMIGAYFGNIKRKEMRISAERALDSFGLINKANHYPSQLSGGEKQRVAIARAIVNKPSIIFADEPTGNLDSKNGEEIFSLLKELNEKNKQTVILVTHDYRVKEFADRIIELNDGKIIKDFRFEDNSSGGIKFVAEESNA